MEIKKVVVIGSGTMGSGIAAHLCNAGVPVTLLDLTTEISEKARERIHKSRPPLLIDKSKIHNINVGNIDENFDVVKDADWVVEAVVERIDIKHNIYDKIFKNRKKGAIVSSNTSSIPIKVLSEKLTDEEIGHLWVAIEVDGDSTLEVEEFANFMDGNWVGKPEKVELQFASVSGTLSRRKIYRPPSNGELIEAENSLRGGGWIGLRNAVYAERRSWAAR